MRCIHGTACRRKRDGFDSHGSSFLLPFTVADITSVGLVPSSNFLPRLFLYPIIHAYATYSTRKKLFRGTITTCKRVRSYVCVCVWHEMEVYRQMDSKGLLSVGRIRDSVEKERERVS